MKRFVALCLLLCLLPLAALAGTPEACMGFGTITADNVNMRKKPNGDLMRRLQTGEPVYVFASEERLDGHTWYHINVKRQSGDWNETGWVRSDFVRLMHEDFTNIKKIRLASSHIVGLREDGTVVGIGEVYTNGFDPTAVGDWRGIKDIAAGICTTIGVKEDGTLVGYGNYALIAQKWDNIDELYFHSSASIGIRKDGSIVLDEGLYGLELLPENGGTGPLPRLEDIWMPWMHVLPVSRGRVIPAILKGRTDTEGWDDIVDVAGSDLHTVILRRDGTVDAFGYNYFGECDVESWTDIVAIGVGKHHTLGVRQDGTVVATGFNEDGQCDVGHWRDIVQVEGGNRVSAALTKDGRVLMVGAYQFEYDNRDAWAYELEATRRHWE